MNPTLNQVSFLKDTLKNDEMVKMQFDTETLFTALNKTDMHTFNLVKWAYRNKKSMYLRDLLIKIGVKPIIN